MNRVSKLVSFEESLTGVAPNEWTIWPFLVTGSSMMIYGRQGLGKSTLAMQMAAGLTATLPSKQQWLDFPVKRAGPVFYLQLDMADAEQIELLKRVAERGLGPSEQARIFFPQFFEQHTEEDQERVYGFDILTPGDYGALGERIADTKPVALIVDTIGDAYYPRLGQNPNDEARGVTRAFKKMLRPVGGSLVYLHHERKKSNKPELVGQDDPDAFLGGVAWEATATTSLQLKGSGQDDEDHHRKYTLCVRKSRLVRLGFDKIDLHKDELGFFYPKWTVRQHLLMWPHTMAYEERFTESREAAFAAIAREAEVDPESVERVWRRLREHGNAPDRWK